MNEKNTTYTGTGIGTIIQIILIVLKLFGLIKLSWGIVLLPTFIGVGLILILFIVLFIVRLKQAKKEKSEND